MDTLFFIFLLLLSLAMLAFVLVPLTRNEDVYKYRCQLIDRSYNVCESYLMSIPPEEYGKENKEYHDKLRNIWSSITNISYDKMLWMFWKPLEDEYWLTKEQIDFLNLKF